jgi:Starch-binding associating with outer membrane
MTNKFTAIAAGIALAAGALACNNDTITNLNNNPNNPTSAPPGPVFTQAVRLSASRFIGNGFSLRQTEFVAQHWAEVQYPDEDRYARLGPADVQGTFNGAYVTEIEDLKNVAKAGLAAANPAVYGPASVLQSWDYEYLTDTWGDVPYSQALAGDSASPNFSPVYDAQKDIYAGLLATLTKATTDMATLPNTGGFGSADPIYGGSLPRWEKFSNSLRARLAMRLVNVDKTTADAQLKAAFSAPGGVFAANSDNAQFAWPGDNVYNNPITDNFTSRDDHRVSNTFANILVGNNDPRTPILMQPTQAFSASGTGPQYAGMPNGLNAAPAGTYFLTSSRPGAIFFPGATTAGTIGTSANKKNPSYLMTYAELSFIQAEAAERGLGGLTAGSAATYYQNGINASMAQWGVTDQNAINTYLAQPGIAYKGGVDGLKQIAIQKWIALVTDGPQSWAEWRRTCQPSTIAPGPAAVVPYVPRRFQYSTVDQSVNPDNYAAAVARQGPDTFGTRIYWDTKPTAAPTC